MAIKTSRPQVRCPRCGNDHVDFISPNFIDSLLALFNIKFLRIRCLRCLWKGRVRYKKQAR